MDDDSDNDDENSFYDEGTDLIIRGREHVKIFRWLRANDVLFSGKKERRILKLAALSIVDEKFEVWRGEYIEAGLRLEEHLEAAFGSTQNFSTVSQDEARPAGRLEAYAFLAAFVRLSVPEGRGGSLSARARALQAVCPEFRGP